MASNYTKLVKYLNSLEEADKPPMGIEGPFFDQFLRCYESLDDSNFSFDYPWEQSHPYDEKIISVGTLTVDFRENTIYCDEEISPDVTVRINYTHNERKADNEFIADFNRLFGLEALEFVFELFSGAKK